MLLNHPFFVFKYNNKISLFLFSKFIYLLSSISIRYATSNIHKKITNKNKLTEMTQHTKSADDRLLNSPSSTNKIGVSSIGITQNKDATIENGSSANQLMDMIVKKVQSIDTKVPQQPLYEIPKQTKQRAILMQVNICN